MTELMNHRQISLNYYI